MIQLSNIRCRTCPWFSRGIEGLTDRCVKYGFDVTQDWACATHPMWAQKLKQEKEQEAKKPELASSTLTWEEAVSHTRLWLGLMITLNAGNPLPKPPEGRGWEILNKHLAKMDPAVKPRYSTTGHELENVFSSGYISQEQYETKLEELEEILES